MSDKVTLCGQLRVRIEFLYLNYVALVDTPLRKMSGLMVVFMNIYTNNSVVQELSSIVSCVSTLDLDL